MFRRPRPEEVEERSSYTRGERVGSSIAHGAPLLVGVPLLLITPLVGGNLFMALVPCPVVAYVISRSFRRQESTWGAFQGMQATLVHLIIVVLSFLFLLSIDSAPTQLVTVLFVSTFLLFLYTLWGAWDTAWGYDFRYVFVSNLVDRITAANQRRQEGRRRHRESGGRDEPPRPTLN